MISTPHLLLRTPTVNDLVVALAAGSDIEAQRWLGWEHQNLMPESLREGLLSRRPQLRRPVFGRPQLCEPLTLVAIDPQQCTYAGMAMITPTASHTCEVGGFLSPTHRGKGLGAELFTAACQFAHHHLGFTEARAGTEPTNTACIRSLHMAGFAPAPGSATHRLPDARIVPAAWFSHNEPNTTTCSATQRKRRV